MWINKAFWKWTQDQSLRTAEQALETLRDNSALKVRLELVERENQMLKANQEWFKLRLNAVEKERAQLIFATLGHKISVPEFVPTYDAPETALAEQPDFAAVGEDARSDADYSLMPQRENN